MDKYKPLILVSNDDGIDAPGLRILIDCIAYFGDVYTVAPDLGQSGQSSAITVNSPLRITQHPDYNVSKMYSVSGTPVDCVKLALHSVLPRIPDIMVCGVNHGSNAGNSIIYSGTMGAVMEACMNHIPSVGFSLLHHSWKADFSECVPFIKSITGSILENKLPDGVCLNVNFPARVKIEGLKVVKAAKSRWSEEYQEFIDPHGKPFYWLTGRQINEEPENKNTDLYWLEHNYATVVPAHADQSDKYSLEFIQKILKEKN